MNELFSIHSDIEACIHFAAFKSVEESILIPQKYFDNNVGSLKVILDLYAKMVSNGSWKDYGLKISSKQVAFSVFKNSSENAVYNICKTFKPVNKNLKYSITDTKGRIVKNSYLLKELLKNINWKKL